MLPSMLEQWIEVASYLCPPLRQGVEGGGSGEGRLSRYLVVGGAGVRYGPGSAREAIDFPREEHPDRVHNTVEISCHTRGVYRGSGKLW